MQMNLPVTQTEINYDDDHVFISRTDTQGIITFANDKFEQISGYTQEELLGSNHNLVRHPDMPEWAFQSLWDTIQSGRPWRGIVKNRSKNGDYYWVRATVIRETNNGEIVGYYSIRRKPTPEEVTHAETLYKPTVE